MAEPKSFSDYMKEAQANLGISASRSPLGGVENIDFSQVNMSGLGGAKSSQAREGTQDPLSWFMDIISRPLYGVTNTVQSQINRQNALSRGEISPLEFFGQQAFNAVVPADFMSGMFSTDPEQHRLFSDVIEESTDEFGRTLDPNYVNVQDNVNPPLKGALGLIGDIAFDPLTIIPGGALLKGASLAGRAAKGTAGAVSGVLRGAEGAKQAEKAAESVLRTAAKTPKATAAGAAAARTGRATEDVSPGQLLMDSPELRERMLADPDLAIRHKEALEGAARRDINRAVNTDRAQRIARALEMFKPTTLKLRAGAKVPTLKEAKPAEFNDNWLSEAANLVSVSPNKVVFNYRGDIKNMDRVFAAALSGNSNARKIARAFYDDVYVPRFVDGKTTGQWMDFLGRPTKAPKPPRTTATLLDSLGAYRKYMAENMERVTKDLGPELIETLGRYTNPANFDRVVTELRNVLDESLDLVNMREVKAPTRALLESIGVNPRTIPTQSRKPRGGANRAPVETNLPETAAEQVAKMDPRSAGDVDFDTVLSIAQQGLDRGIFRDLLKRTVKETHPHRTKKGNYRTAELYGDGQARILRQANAYFQYNLIKHVPTALNQMAKSRGLAGLASASFKSRWGRAVMRVMEDALDAHGVPLVMGVGDDTLPLAMSQVLDIFESINPRTINRTYWNGSTAVPHTNLMEATVAAVRGADRAEIERLLLQTKSRYVRSDGREIEIPNNLSKGGRILEHGKKSFVSSKTLVKELTDLIEESVPAIKDVISDNAARFQARRLEETGLIADSVLGELDALYEAKNGFGALLDGIDSMATRVKGLSERFGTTQDATNLANSLTKAVVPAGDKAAAKAAVNTSKAVQSGKNLKEGQKLAAEEAQKGYEEAAKALFDDIGEGLSKTGIVTDYGTTISSRIHNGLLRKIIPVFSRTWTLNAGFRSRFLRSESTYFTATSRFANELRVISRSQLSVQTLANLLKNAQRGLPGTPETAEVQAHLQKLWSKLFDTAPGSLTSMSNGFLRNGNNLEYVNEALRRNKLNDGTSGIMFDIAKLDKAHTQGRLSEEMLDQALSWDLEDPVNQLYGLYKSFMDVQVQQTIAQDFLKMVDDLKVVSRAAKDGYVRVEPAEFKKFGAYLRDDVWIQEDVLNQMRQIDTIWQQSMDLNGPLGKLIRDVYQPTLQAWKYGMTLPNPTHHIRNFVSDTTLTALAEGFNPFMHRKGFRAALQAMATRNSYDSVDAVKALQGINEIPDAGAIVSQGLHGKITADGLYTAMANRGNLLSYRYLEHINEDLAFGAGTGRLFRGWHHLQSTEAVRIIGGVSEYRDHLVRLQHAAIFIEKNINNKKFKNMDELLDAASDTVRKWHPDGTDLTRAEQYFRLIIPFYSWQRKAIPLIVEAMLTHPGRISIIPKAEFNMAVAAGINPDSLADPFPDDQMFPSFLTEQMTGPIMEFDGKYYGVNPGFASNDILNDWLGANPIRSLAGMTSPHIKMPFELLAGAQVGTGAKINDFSDYLDSNIPLVGALSRMTGTSVTGSLVSLPTGQGFDPQHQVARGNYEPGERQLISTLNWLLGLGITPMSLPNYINYAEIEKRNAAGDISPEDSVVKTLLR